MSSPSFTFDAATRLAATSVAETATPDDWFKLSGGYKFGKRPFKTKEENHKWNFLQADDGAPAWNVERAGAAKGVKFGAGFARRRAEDIGHDKSRKQFERAKAGRQEQVAATRRKFLASVASKAGFHPITGDALPGHTPIPLPRPAVKYHGGKLSQYLQREGDVLLRVSDSRPKTRTPDDPRTQRIATEGLVTSTRASSVLGIGRAEMRSYGVRDNFEYSCYDPAYRQPSPRDAPAPPLGASWSSVAPPAAPSTRAATDSRDHAHASPSSTYSKPPRDRTLGRPSERPVPTLRPSASASSVLSRSASLRSSRAASRREAEIRSVRELA